MPAGTGLWRAQLGHGWKPHCEGNRYITDIPAPYPPARMKPLPTRATEGRANPKGIPALYLTTHKKTAMSEVRPGLGSFVSCAHFTTTRDLKIIDFSVHHDSGFVLHFSEPDASKREKAIWRQIDRAFSEPTTAEGDTADYVPTQVIAELFRNEGYDGLAYKSAFGKKGYNVVLFNLADAEPTYCNLFEVKSLKFGFEQSGNPYWVEKDGITKSVHITDVKPIPPSEESE
ncbi:MAG: RES family NAD+ phosphorylase [Rhodobacteraceae bacterium]|nr:RES family NAD+ phosphorylase [Paracoccaceae bacterium]